MKNHPIIEKLEAHVTTECSKIDVESAFNDMLDECYSFKGVGGPFEHMSPSRVLLECDPIAHRCGVSDYSDGQDWYEINGDYYEQREADKAKEEFIDALRDELTDLEQELSDEEARGDDEDLQESRRLAAAIAEKQAEIDACESHSF